MGLKQRVSKIFFHVKNAVFGEGTRGLKNTWKRTEIHCSAGVQPNYVNVRQITCGYSRCVRVKIKVGINIFNNIFSWTFFWFSFPLSIKSLRAEYFHIYISIEIYISTKMDNFVRLTNYHYYLRLFYYLDMGPVWTLKSITKSNKMIVQHSFQANWAESTLQLVLIYNRCVIINASLPMCSHTCAAVNLCSLKLFTTTPLIYIFGSRLN